jgi:hypothetical protein
MITRRGKPAFYEINLLIFNKEKMIGKNLIDKICMCRTYSAGVHYGIVSERDGKEVLLKKSRRVHYWDGAASLSQLAIEGSKKIDNCRIAIEIPEILITEVVEVIPMTPEAVENLEGSQWKM